MIELCAQRTDLVRARFVSRHSNNKNYIATIQFNVDTECPINSWFCTCISGSRDVGCCAHVTALLWHLGVSQAEHDNKLHPLSAGHLLLSIDDSTPLPDIDDSDHNDDDDDDLESSEADSTTHSDDSTDSDDVAI